MSKRQKIWKWKTLHRYWQNLFFNLFLLLLLFNLSLGISFFVSVSAAKNEMPGILESLDRINSLEQKYQHQKKSTALEIKSDSNEDTNLWIIDPNYLRTLLLYSPIQNLSLLNGDECHFYSLLDNQLLEEEQGPSKFLFFKKKSNESIKISSESFFKLLYSQRCSHIRDLKTIFSGNIASKTIENTIASMPKNDEECSSIWHDWILNEHTPFLCSNLKNNPKYFNDFQKNYFSNLCTSLNNQKKFCEPLIKNDSWSKIISGNKPLTDISFLCQKYLKISPQIFSDSLTRQCANQFYKNPGLCEKQLSTNVNQLMFYPNDDCNAISEALMESKMNATNSDCPFGVNHLGIINTHRLLTHFNLAKNKFVDINECQFDSLNNFYDFSQLIKKPIPWPFKICYFNSVEKKQACTPYVPGKPNNDPLSMEVVVQKILYKYYGVPKKTICHAIPKSEYQPALIKFQNGCYILQEEFSMYNGVDKKIVASNAKIIDSISFSGTFQFEYATSSYLTEQSDLVHLLNEAYKLKSSTIMNISELKYYVTPKTNGIAHGVGCLEDLLPESFFRQSLYDCRPIPFIVDGLSYKENNPWLTVRLSIQDIHTPKLIPWQNIFHAVAAYSEIHPLKTWTFYGIKKQEL